MSKEVVIALTATGTISSAMDQVTELDIAQEWSKIKEMYSSTCIEVLGKSRRDEDMYE